jgi:hypothetical protein
MSETDLLAHLALNMRNRAVSCLERRDARSLVIETLATPSDFGDHRAGRCAGLLLLVLLLEAHTHLVGPTKALLGARCQRMFGRDLAANQLGTFGGGHTP